MSTPSERVRRRWRAPSRRAAASGCGTTGAWAIGAVSRHCGVGALMSITAVRPSELYARGPLKSGSAHVPDFMILFGRYMTALWPSIGLVPTVDHVHVAGSRIRVVVSGPASKMLPVRQHEHERIER